MVGSIPACWFTPILLDYTPPWSQIPEAPCAHFASDAVVGLRRPQVTFAEATNWGLDQWRWDLHERTKTLSKTGGSKCKEYCGFYLCWKMDWSKGWFRGTADMFAMKWMGLLYLAAQNVSSRSILRTHRRSMPLIHDPYLSEEIELIRGNLRNSCVPYVRTAWRCIPFFWAIAICCNRLYQAVFEGWEVSLFRQSWGRGWVRILLGPGPAEQLGGWIFWTVGWQPCRTAGGTGLAARSCWVL